MLARGRIRVQVTQRDAGAALCTSLLLQLLHGTNPKQHSVLRALLSYFQRDVARAWATGDCRLHKDSSHRSIAGGEERDRLFLVPRKSRAMRAYRAHECYCVAPQILPLHVPPGFERKIMNNQDGLEHELDVLLAKAGASVPPHLKAGILAGYRDMKVMAATVRQPRTAAAEPSNVFSLTGFARSA